jgi:hypothetical protein
MRNCASGNPYARSWLWIPGSRYARPGMTKRIKAGIAPGLYSFKNGSRLCDAAQVRRIASGTLPQFSDARFGGVAGHDLIRVS